MIQLIKYALHIKIFVVSQLVFLQHGLYPPFRVIHGLHENIDFLEKKIEQYQNDLEASKAEYDKPFAYSEELNEKLARQCELNAQLDLENAKAVDADLSGPEEERETDDRMEPAAIVAEDKGAYPADREGRTR